MLERTVPTRYQKVVFMDCDVDFASPDWYHLTSVLLEDNDVVQPFHIAQWMNVNYSSVLRVFILSSYFIWHQVAFISEVRMSKYVQ